jgi:deazaflavin-dependent oxidoreductase (nitroreductase family)
MPNPFAKSRSFHRLANYSGPPAFFRVLPLPRGFALLTVTGRKTGTLRRRPIRAIRDGSTLYAVAILGERSDWLLNARKTPDVRVRVGAKWHSAHVRDIADSQERDKARKLYVETVVPYDYFDVPLVEWTVPTPGKIVHKHEKWFDGGVPVAIELESKA